MGRSTVILAVVAGALLAFILLHERDLLSSAELEGRKNRVLTTFVRERLTRIEVVRAGQTIVLERAPSADPEEEGALGPWKQTAPMQVAVDQEAVDVLIGELEWLQPRRVIEDISGEDHERFGFDKPRIEVRYTVGKQRSVLLVGDDEPTGIGLYARADDADVAYIVGKDLFEALDHDAGHFHTKELHGGIFLFASSAVVVRVNGGQTRTELRDGTWRIDTPVKSILASSEVEAVIKGLDQLRAKRFIADGLKGPLSYGLDAPSLVVTVERERSTDADKSTKSPITLRVGAACDAHADEKYVQVNAGPVMCAATADLDPLARPLSELVDRSPLPADPERLTEITLETPSRSIVLTKSEERWQYSVVVDGKQSSAGDADREAVTEWMKSLRGLQFTARTDIAPQGEELVTFKLKSTGSTARVDARASVGPDGAVHVQRTGEVDWLRYDPSAATLLSPFVSRFRSLALIDEADAPMSSVTVSRGDTTETVERTADGWRLTAPIVAAGDPVALSDVAHLLTRLSAVRFVADGAEPQHGLDRSAVRVTFKIGAVERTLLLGNAASDGVFGQLLGEGAVFIVPTRVIETVSSGLLARTVLATPLEEIESVTLVAAGRTYAVKRDGGRFVAVPPTSDAAAVTSAVERVSRLRAEAVVHYGAALPVEGFQRPKLTIAVERTGDADHEARYDVMFGNATNAGGAPQVFVRRSDVDATLTSSQASLDRLVELAQ